MNALPQNQNQPQNQPQPHNRGDASQLTDVKTLREQARRHVEEGAVTEHYGANKAKVIELLNEALSTELVCVLRYRHDYYMARGIHSNAVATEFLEHSNEEQAHADQIAERIVQLGGEPDFSPDSLSGRSHAEYVPGGSLVEMIKEDLVAERIAIDSYREIINFLAERDSTTRRLMEEILAVEEQHADELVDFLEDLPPAVRERAGLG